MERKGSKRWQRRETAPHSSLRARQTHLSWSSCPASHPIMVLFFQIAALLFALRARTHPEVPALSIAFVFCCFSQVRFSPNLDSYGWLVSGGQSGPVRIHFVRGLTCPLGHRMQLESRAIFQCYVPTGLPLSRAWLSSTSHCLLPVLVMVPTGLSRDEVCREQLAPSTQP